MSGGKRNFRDIASAMAMRDLIVKVSEGVVNRMRPETFAAEVYEFNPFSRKALVRRSGMKDTEPSIEVSFITGIQPDAAHGVANGTIVEVEGSPGNYWIKKILAGEWRMQDGRLVNARFNGGEFSQVERESQYVIEPRILPAVGSTIGLGYWTNEGRTTWSEGKAELKVRIHQELFTSVIKTYDVLLMDRFGDDVWRTLAPEKDSGTQTNNDFALEIKIDPGKGFWLRIRRLTGGITTPGGYYADVRILGQKFYHVKDTVDLEELDARPTEYFGRSTVERDETYGTVSTGPYSSGLKHTIEVRQSQQVVLPDSFVWDGSYIKWTGSFSVVGTGVNDLSSSGRINIGMPSLSSVISMHGHSTFSGMGTDPNGIGLGTQGDATLYYEPPYFSNGTTSEARFHLVYQSLPFKVPSHWIMLAAKAPNSASGNSLILPGGQTFDHWRDLTLQNGFTQHGGGYDNGSYRKIGDRVELRGLVDGGTTNGTFATLPDKFRPTGRKIFTVGIGSGLTSRMDVQTSGVMATNGASNNSFVSLEGIFFSAAL